MPYLSPKPFTSTSNHSGEVGPKHWCRRLKLNLERLIRTKEHLQACSHNTMSTVLSNQSHGYQNPDYGCGFWCGYSSTDLYPYLSGTQTCDPPGLPNPCSSILPRYQSTSMATKLMADVLYYFIKLNTIDNKVTLVASALAT